MTIKEKLAKIPNDKIKNLKKAQLIELVQACINELSKTEQKISTQYNNCQNKITTIENFNLEEKNQQLLEAIEEQKNKVNEYYGKVEKFANKIFENNEEGWKDKIENFYNELFAETNDGEENYKK